jgi:hypothetical protein
MTSQLAQLKTVIKCKDELIAKKDKIIGQLIKEKEKFEANYDFCAKALRNYQ